MRGSGNATFSGRGEASRKLRRRREREAKKARRVAAQRTRSGASRSEDGHPKGGGGGGGGGGGAELSRVKASILSGPTSSRRSESEHVQHLPESQSGREMERRRRRRDDQERQLMAERREVSRLEKKLGMKKRKKLPSSFKDDGLDYILDLTEVTGSGGEGESGDETEYEVTGTTVGGKDPGCDSEDDEPVETDTRCHRAEGGRRRRKGLSSTEEREFNDDLNLLTSSKRARLSPEKEEEEEEEEKEVEEEKNEEEEEESDGFTDESGDSEFDEHQNEDEEEEEEEEIEEEEEAVMEEKIKTCYIPPHTRHSRGGGGGGGGGQRSADIDKLHRTLQGLINRLNESNVQSIATQLEVMYTQHSRNDLNSCLSEVMLKACVSPTLLSERFAMLHVLLVAIVHNNVGSEVGAYLLQRLAQKLDYLLSQPPNYGQGKECDCVLLLLAYLYTFKVVHCVIIYDIIRKLLDSFTERDIELLLLLLRNTGMDIRRDDASSLKDIILQIQSKAAVSSNLKDSSRTRYMLETITALKSNNSRKIPNYDPSLLDHMRRLMRGLLHSKGPADENQLKISLNDLLMADQQGRWWVVGSAWTGREAIGGSQVPEVAPVTTVAAATVGVADSWVLELAKKQRMNTDVRRNIFCVIMTSEDCVDAFEKLLKLGLKEKQEREIVHVLIDCCIQEKQFNPYYAYLGQKFCEYSRSHQVTFQYSLWDRMKTLSEMTSFGRENLRKFLLHLFLSQALSLSVLRIVEFTELRDGKEIEFYRKLLHTLLLSCTDWTLKSVFSRLANQPHLKSLRDSLLLFMRHNFSLPTSSTSTSTSTSHTHTSTSSSTSSTSSSTATMATQNKEKIANKLEQIQRIMRTVQPII